MSEAPELLPCPWGCTPKHGPTKGQRDMHGELNQNYAVWCEHARITAADRERAFGIWNARADIPATDEQALANPKVQALVEALEKAAERLDASRFTNAEHAQAREIIRAALEALGLDAGEGQL